MKREKYRETLVEKGIMIWPEKEEFSILLPEQVKFNRSKPKKIEVPKVQRFEADLNDIFRILISIFFSINKSKSVEVKI